MVRTVLGKISAGVLISGPRHFIITNSRNFPNGVKGWCWIQEHRARNTYFVLKFRPFEN